MLPIHRVTLSLLFSLRIRASIWKDNFLDKSCNEANWSPKNHYQPKLVEMDLLSNIDKKDDTAGEVTINRQPEMEFHNRPPFPQPFYPANPYTNPYVWKPYSFVARYPMQTPTIFDTYRERVLSNSHNALMTRPFTALTRETSSKLDKGKSPHSQNSERFPVIPKGDIFKDTPVSLEHFESKSQSPEASNKTILHMKEGQVFMQWTLNRAIWAFPYRFPINLYWSILSLHTTRAQKELGEHESLELSDFQMMLDQFCVKLHKDFSASGQLKWKRSAGKKLIKYVKSSTQESLLYIRLINDVFQPTLFKAEEVPVKQLDAFSLFRTFWETIFLEQNYPSEWEEKVKLVKSDFLKGPQFRPHGAYYAAWDLTEIWMMCRWPLLYEWFGGKGIQSISFIEFLQDRVLFIYNKFRSPKSLQKLEKNSKIYDCPGYPRISYQIGIQSIPKIFQKKRKVEGFSNIEKSSKSSKKLL
ncbi:hypothetical protein O181_042499 [Austropuccinia psidii MF-1]|uniref:Uncharacterized protein n=1 Tax=Austropuccinia psidii MF-1 TaxID=1389203 RepID=A0A9Q3DGI8_9BASI|nr:hypothetical protein [Austropuccinia psidii MF-1]